MTGDPLTITLEHAPKVKDARVVSDGLLRHNAERHGPPGHRPFGVFVRDARGIVRGGLVGRLWWQWLHVEKLWLAASLRGQGLGTRLLADAEGFALSEGCTHASLDTIDEEALAFYRARGYEVFGTLEDFPPGGRQWFLRKRLGGSPTPAAEPLPGG